MPAIPLPYPDKIARKSEKSSKFLTISADMGDTLSQTAPKGLNPVRDTWKIEWVAITTTEKLLLEAILKTNGSWNIYSWTPCYETVEQYFRLTADGYSVQHKGGNNDFTIKCELNQVFDIIV